MYKKLDYRLLKAGDCVGKYTTTSDLNGMFVTILEPLEPPSGYLSANERLPTIAHKQIVIPIKYKLIKDDGLILTYERYLDVTKKSKRQIKVINNLSRDVNK